MKTYQSAILIIIKLFIISIILCFNIINLSAQNIEDKKQLFPINISLMHESLSIPSIINPIQYKYNPAFSIGTEYLLIKKNKHDFHLSGNLGFYHHREWETTVFTEVKFGYRHYIKRFSITTNLGLGYAHIFTPKSTYKFEGDQFKEVSDKGRPALQASFSISPSFKIFKRDNSPEIYLPYTFALQLPLSDVKGFHQFIGVGCKFYPFKGVGNK